MKIGDKAVLYPEKDVHDEHYIVEILGFTKKFVRVREFGNEKTQLCSPDKLEFNQIELFNPQNE